MTRLYGCMVTKIHAIFISSLTCYWRGDKIFVTFLLTFTLFRVANKLSKNWEYSQMKTLWNRLNKTAESQQGNKDVVWKMNDGLITRSLKHDSHRKPMDAATPTQKSAANADLSVLAWTGDEQRVCRRARSGHCYMHFETQNRLRPPPANLLGLLHFGSCAAEVVVRSCRVKSSESSWSLWDAVCESSGVRKWSGTAFTSTIHVNSPFSIFFWCKYM